MDCVFCRIIGGREQATIVYEDEKSIAFLDHYPLNPGHTLVLPKKHYDTLDEMPLGEVGELFTSVAKVMKGVRKASKAHGINIGQSNGVAASQEVFHVHVHVIPRYSNDSPGGLTFPDRKAMSLREREDVGKRVKAAIDSETH